LGAGPDKRQAEGSQKAQGKSPDQLKAQNNRPQATDAQARAGEHTREEKEKKEKRNSRKDARSQEKQILRTSHATRPGQVKNRNNESAWHDSLRCRDGHAAS
jgi:hypothetical protein